MLKFELHIMPMFSVHGTNIFCVLSFYRYKVTNSVYSYCMNMLNFCFILTVGKKDAK